MKNGSWGKQVQLLISDANILIDMKEGQLIKVLFQLPYQFLTPDILFYEELEGQHDYLLKAGLQLSELSGETMQYAQQVIERHSKPSRHDCFAIALAHQEKCTLLTGDKDLKKAASIEGIDVKGTIWIVSQMARKRLITVEQARLAYQKMRETGRRLPWDIAEKELTEIQNGQN